MAAIFNPRWRTTDHKLAKGSNFFMTHIPCIYQIWGQILYSLKCMVNLTQLLEYGAYKKSFGSSFADAYFRTGFLNMLTDNW